MATRFRFIWAAIITVAVTGSGGASAGIPLFGASFGAIFPADRLTMRSDEMGTSLYPAPAVGVFGKFDALESVPQLSLEAMAEFALFQSNEDPDLRIVYFPVQLAGIWEAANRAGLGLQIRLGLGPAFMSSNRGQQRSLALFGGSLGGRVETGFRNLDCALEAGLDVLFQGTPQTLLRFRILLFTR